MKNSFFRAARRGVLLIGVAAFLGAVPLGQLVARADERMFTYSEDAEVEAVGKWEFEQWITHRRGKSGQSYSAWDFREEIEYGLVKNLKTAVYLNFGQQDVSSHAVDSSQFKFRGISGELKYRILDPEKKPFGLAVYFEPTFSGNSVELEEKIIFQKEMGKWNFVVNATIEQEWERELGATKKEMKLEFTTGLAYRLSRHWGVGIEGRRHTVFDGHGFNHQLGSAWFVGPNVRYTADKWSAALTVLPQASGTPKSGGLDLGEHERIEIRLVISRGF